MQTFQIDPEVWAGDYIAYYTNWAHCLSQLRSVMIVTCTCRNPWLGTVHGGCSLYVHVHQAATYSTCASKGLIELQPASYFATVVPFSYMIVQMVSLERILVHVCICLISWPISECTRWTPQVPLVLPSDILVCVVVEHFSFVLFFHLAHDRPHFTETSCNTRVTRNLSSIFV